MMGHKNIRCRTVKTDIYISPRSHISGLDTCSFGCGGDETTDDFCRWRASESACTCITNNIDCVVEWPEWNECSKECGGGTQTRAPIITMPQSGSGDACPGDETKECNTNPCAHCPFPSDIFNNSNLENDNTLNTMVESSYTIECNDGFEGGGKVHCNQSAKPNRR